MRLRDRRSGDPSRAGTRGQAPRSCRRTRVPDERSLRRRRVQALARKQIGEIEADASTRTRASPRPGSATGSRRGEPAEGTGPANSPDCACEGHSGSLPTGRMVRAGIARRLRAIIPGPHCTDAGPRQDHVTHAVFFLLRSRCTRRGAERWFAALEIALSSGSLRCRRFDHRRNGDELARGRGVRRRRAQRQYRHCRRQRLGSNIFNVLFILGSAR